MSLRHLRPADAVAAGLGIALLAVMTFSDWFETAGTGENAWETFVVTDFTLALSGAGAVALAVLTAVRSTPAWALVATVVTVVLAWIGALILAYRLLNQPGANDVVEVAAGAYAGLVLLTALALTAARALKDERTPGLEPQPEPELMPAPVRAAQS